MQIEIHDSATSFDRLKEEWEALLPRCSKPTIFLTPEWQRAWWETFGMGRELHLLAVRDEDGKLIAVAPLFMQETIVDDSPWPAISIERPVLPAKGRKMRTVHFVGGTEVSDYLDLVVDRNQVSQTCAAVMNYLMGECWELIDFHNIPGDSPTIEVFISEARKRGYKLNVAREDVCPFVDLPPAWEQYLAALTKKQRHELRRKRRKAVREARVDWDLVRDPSDLEVNLEVFFDLHIRSDPDKADFLDAQMQEFFRRVATFALQRGWLWLAFILINGQPDASILCFDYNQEILVYNSGYDPHTYPMLSSGMVLMGYLIQRAIETGHRRFDFMQGGERYKYDFGAKDAEVKRLCIRRP